MKDFLKIWISEKRDIFLVPLEVTEVTRKNFLVPFKVTENFSWFISRSDSLFLFLYLCICF